MTDILCHQRESDSMLGVASPAAHGITANYSLNAGKSAVPVTKNRQVTQHGNQCDEASVHLEYETIPQKLLPT